MERNAAKRVATPKRAAGARYTPTAYAHAVARACKQTGVDPWHPNQLRHTFATRVRKGLGWEGAQVPPGDTKADVTGVYAERDGASAAKVAAAMG
jgi:integrase